MNLQYYYNYIAIVEEGSLTAAARKLGIAQPALSNQIKVLEQKYGTRLFFRGSRKLELTDAGQILYRKVKRMCEMEIEAKSEIASGFSGTRGTLKLGRTSSAICPKLHACFNSFLQVFPEVNLSIYEKEQDELVTMILSGAIDACIARFVGDPKENFEVVFRTEDIMVTAFRKDSHLMDHIKGETVSPEQLNKVPLSAIPRLSFAVRNSIRRSGGEAIFRCVSNRVPAVLEAARGGHSVAITAMRTISELDFPDLDIKPLTADFVPAVSMNFITQQARYRSPIVNSFIRTYAEHYNLPLPMNLSDDKNLGE